MNSGTDPVPRPFREIAPVAWSYHRGTCRWTHNASHPVEDWPEHPEEHLAAPYHPLPPPAAVRSPLADLLSKRFSCRVFTAEPLTFEQVATLAAAAYGTIGHAAIGLIGLPERPVPSGGGMYPLELYFLIRSGGAVPAGVHHYHPHAHGLEHLRDVELPARYLTYLFMNQRWFAEAAAVVVLTGLPRRTARKYGDRGYRYLLLEAGHIAQNLVLAAGSLGLATCCGGGFFDDELAGLLVADIEDEVPVYAIAVGSPAPLDRASLRRGEASDDDSS